MKQDQDEQSDKKIFFRTADTEPSRFLSTSHMQSHAAVDPESCIPSACLTKASWADPKAGALSFSTDMFNSLKSALLNAAHT